MSVTRTPGCRNPQLVGDPLFVQAIMFAYCTPGTWTTFVAPVPRMMFSSDCMPTVE